MSGGRLRYVRGAARICQGSGLGISEGRISEEGSLLSGPIAVFFFEITLTTIYATHIIFLYISRIPHRGVFGGRTRLSLLVRNKQIERLPVAGALFELSFLDRPAKIHAELAVIAAAPSR